MVEISASIAKWQGKHITVADLDDMMNTVDFVPVNELLLGERSWLVLGMYKGRPVLRTTGLNELTGRLDAYRNTIAIIDNDTSEPGWRIYGWQIYLFILLLAMAATFVIAHYRTILGGA